MAGCWKGSAGEGASRSTQSSGGTVYQRAMQGGQASDARQQTSKRHDRWATSSHVGDGQTPQQLQGPGGQPRINVRGWSTLCSPGYLVHGGVNGHHWGTVLGQQMVWVTGLHGVLAQLKVLDVTGQVWW